MGVGIYEEFMRNCVEMIRIEIDGQIETSEAVKTKAGDFLEWRGRERVRGNGSSRARV